MCVCVHWKEVLDTLCLPEAQEEPMAVSLHFSEQMAKRSWPPAAGIMLNTFLLVLL